MMPPCRKSPSSSGSGVNPEPITPTGLAAYLAGDQDTRTFLVTGPLSAIGGPHEQFRP